MPMTLPLSIDNTDQDAKTILQYLPELAARLHLIDDQEAYLRRFFRRKDMQILMKLCKRFHEWESKMPRPLTVSSVTMAANVFCDIRRGKDSKEADHLIEILSKPHLQALLYAHDKVATKEYDNSEHKPHVNSVYGNDSDVQEERFKIVQLIKSNEPLGVTIQRNRFSDATEIARIIHGGAAHRSGLIHVGDEILEINGIPFRGRSPDDLAALLTRLSGPVTMKLGPHYNNNTEKRPCNLRVRAFFNYNPYQDGLIPCPSAGLSFMMGDILHIVNQDDPYWWQAKLDVAETATAGLIPSRILQERREFVSRRNKSDENSKRRRSRSLSPCRISPRLNRAKRIRKMMYQAVQNGEFELGDIPTYEDVELLNPNPLHRRPLVLIGAPNVGRNEMKRRLIGWKPDHFIDIVPYTSRPKRKEEEEGREYHYVTRREMESGILARRFVEHGEYKCNLYGTRTDSIHSVINSGKVCILSPSVKAIPYLRTADIKPYIIFIRSPSMATLKETRRKYHAMVTSDRGDTFLFTDDELSRVVTKSAQIEEQYGHWFDRIIVNDDIQRAVKELIKVANMVESQPQWVPASWT